MAKDCNAPKNNSSDSNAQADSVFVTLSFQAQTGPTREWFIDSGGLRRGQAVQQKADKCGRHNLCKQAVDKGAGYWQYEFETEWRRCITDRCAACTRFGCQPVIGNQNSRKG